MDLNTLALWFVALNAGGLFLRSAREPRQRWDWLLVCSVILVSASVGWLLFPSSAGYLSGALSLLLLVLPNWASSAASRSVKRAMPARARWFARLAAISHPSRDLRAMPALFEAFELAYVGKLGEAEAQLQVLSRGTGNVAQLAFAHRLRILGRWREVKALVERPQLGVPISPSLIAIYVRALGELGCIEELADFMRANEASLLGTGMLELTLLSLFAFTGHTELTRRILGSGRGGYAAETRDFWLAMAAQHAGDLPLARLGFGQLRSARDAQIRGQAEQRFKNLAHAESEPAPSAHALLVVNYFARAFTSKQNLLLTSPVSWPQRVLVTLLTVVNAVVFVLGSWPLLNETHEDFGKRWSFFAPDILAGQWWRAFSYLFVHANYLHLLMNMGSLWVLGPFVERAYGRLRFTAIYLAAGCTGSAAYLALFWHGMIKPEELVGASGCIMGLLGGIIAVMLRAWFRQREAVDKALLLRLLIVVAVQVVFDHETPQVAGLAHALGLLGGLLCGLLVRDQVSTRPALTNPV